MATTLFLARHGETDWNAGRRWQGHANPPLNDRGREQAAALARLLAPEPLDAVYASDLRRAYETARVVADGRGLEVTTIPELREVDVGSWSGMTREEIRHRFPEGFRRWAAQEGHGWEDGESYEEMAERVVAALLRVATHHRDGSVLVVTHGGPVRAALGHASGLSALDARRELRVVENCDVARLAVEDGTFRALD